MICGPEPLPEIVAGPSSLSFDEPGDTATAPYTAPFQYQVALLHRSRDVHDRRPFAARNAIHVVEQPRSDRSVQLGPSTGGLWGELLIPGHDTIAANLRPHPLKHTLEDGRILLRGVSDGRTARTD